MAISDEDITALRECIIRNTGLSYAEKGMLIDAITVAIIRYEQKEKKEG